MPRSHVADPTAVDVPDVLRMARNGAAFAVFYAAASRFADAALSTAELPPTVFVPGALVPVHFKNGRGVYVEPNIWIRHPFE